MSMHSKPIYDGLDLSEIWLILKIGSWWNFCIICTYRYYINHNRFITEYIIHRRYSKLALKNT